jgi:hypothetical protein
MAIPTTSAFTRKLEDAPRCARHSVRAAALDTICESAPTDRTFLKFGKYQPCTATWLPSSPLESMREVALPIPPMREITPSCERQHCVKTHVAATMATSSPRCSETAVSVLPFSESEALCTASGSCFFVWSVWRRDVSRSPWGSACPAPSAMPALTCLPLEAWPESSTDVRRLHATRKL